MIDPRLRASQRYFNIERWRVPAGATLKRITGQRVADLAHALYKGVWLGALDDDQLAAITQTYYAAQGPEWRNTGWTELGLHAWEREAVDRHFSDCKSLLIGCAGGGREAFALAREGFAVKAFDCSPAMVRAAREHAARTGLDVDFVFYAPDRVPNLGSYDGAIVGWGGYMHVIGAARRTAFLRGFRARLATGAPLLVSFYVRDEKNAALAATASVGSFVRRVRRKQAIELGDELRPRFFRRTFTRADIERELSAAGFRLSEFSRTGDDGWAVGTAVE